MDDDTQRSRWADARILIARATRRPGLTIAVTAVLVGVFVSEALLFAERTWPAIWVHLLTLLACLFWLQFGRSHPIISVLALVPLFRLVNLGMPIFFQLTVYWFPLVYGPLIPALVYVDHLEDTVPVPFALRRGLLLAPAAIAIGAVLAAIEFTILEPEALVPTWSVPQVLMITIVMVCFVGFVEEYLFRGLIQGTAEREFGRWPGIVLASCLFGALHSGYGVPEEMLFAAFAGLVFGILYDVLENLTFVTLIHGFLNVFLFAVYPIHGLPFG